MLIRELQCRSCMSIKSMLCVGSKQLPSTRMRREEACSDALVAHWGLWEWLLWRGKKNIRTMRRNHKEGSMNRSRRAISWVWFVKHPVVPLSRSSAVPAPHVLSVGARHLKANDTLMTFFIKVFSAFVEETQRHTRVCLQPKAASLQRWKWWHSEQTWTQSQGGYANYSTACISKEWNPGSSVE